MKTIFVQLLLIIALCAVSYGYNTTIIFSGPWGFLKSDFRITKISEFDVMFTLYSDLISTTKGNGYRISFVISQIGDIPQEYWPSKPMNFNFICNNLSSKIPCRGIIDTDGRIVFMLWNGGIEADNNNPGGVYAGSAVYGL
jgi:hypothetical protein